jgi:hypothetical protein
MKSKDIITIVIVAVVSGVISIVLSNIFISSDKNRSEKVEVVTPISADLERPPKDYYNNNSINPTQTIQIGNDSTSQPFGSQ